jgi:hypothetical protein
MWSWSMLSYYRNICVEKLRRITRTSRQAISGPRSEPETKVNYCTDRVVHGIQLSTYVRWNTWSFASMLNLSFHEEIRYMVNFNIGYKNMEIK